MINSSDMPIEHCSEEPQQGQGGDPHHPRCNAVCMAPLLDELVMGEIEPMIREINLLGIPSSLKLEQACVFRLASPQADRGKTPGLIPPQGLPHHQVVGPEIQEPPVRSAVFVNRIFPEVEVHAR